MSDNRTEQPTPKRLREARAKGQVAQSRDLSDSVTTLGVLTVLFFLGRNLAGSILEFTRTLWSDSARVTIDADGFVSLMTGATLTFLRPFFWLAAAAAIIPAILAFAQRGWLFLPNRLAPDFSRLVPGNRLGQIFSADGFYPFVSGLAKFGVVAAVLFWDFPARIASLTEPFAGSGADAAIRLTETLFGIAFRITFGFCLLSVLDLFYQRWKYRHDLRMTPQEIREERREDSGDDQVRAKRRAEFEAISAVSAQSPARGRFERK